MDINQAQGCNEAAKSPEYLQELCEINPYLKGWLEALYALSGQKLPSNNHSVPQSE